MPGRKQFPKQGKQGARGAKPRRAQGCKRQPSEQRGPAAGGFTLASNHLLPVVFIGAERYIQIMKHGGKAAISLAIGLGLQTAAQAMTDEAHGNPYAGIVDRNVFALKPKPIVPTGPATPELPPQKVIPLGIVNANGKKQVLWKTTIPARPGEPAKEKSFMTSEGEREGEIEILEIQNDPAGTIKIMNSGKPVTLTLKDDAPKPTGGAGAVPGAPPGAPSIPGVPGLPVVPMNTGIPGSAGNTVTTFGGGGATTVQRPLRVAPTTASGYATAAGGTAQNANKAAEPALSPEEQAVMIEINRKITADAVKRGDMPPLPPGLLPGP